MRPVIKTAEAIKDLMAQGAATKHDGFETVLLDELPTIHSGVSLSDTCTNEDEDFGILKVIQKRRWEEVMQRITEKPKLCSFRFAVSESGSNFLLHEACKKQPPQSLLDTILKHNMEAVKRRGEGGSLPLHIACANDASADVIACLLSVFPGSIHMVENTDRMLPLHLAAKFGMCEDAMMVLLSSFPEAMMVKDAFGRVPMDFARGQTNTALRVATVSYLDRGGWLCSASASARHWAELAHNKQMEEFEAQMEGAIDELATQHRNTEAKLEETITNLEATLATKQKKIELLEKSVKMQSEKLFEESKTKKDLEAKDAELKDVLMKMKNLEVTFGEKVCQLSETYGSRTADIKEDFEAEKTKMNMLIKNLNDRKAALEEENTKQANRIKLLENVIKGQGHDFDDQISTMAKEISNLQVVLGETKTALEQTSLKLVKTTLKSNELACRLQRKEAERDASTKEAKQLREQVENLASLMTSIQHLSNSGTIRSASPIESSATVMVPTRKANAPTMKLARIAAYDLSDSDDDSVIVADEARSDESVVGTGGSAAVSARE